MPQTKTAAPVLQHRNGQTKKFITCILPYISPICKAFANFMLTACGSTCCTSALPIGQVLFSALPYLYFVRHGRVLSLYPLKPEDNQKGCFRTLACVLLSCASHPVEVTASVDIYPSRIVTSILFSRFL